MRLEEIKYLNRIFFFFEESILIELFAVGGFCHGGSIHVKYQLGAKIYNLVEIIFLLVGTIVIRGGSVPVND